MSELLRVQNLTKGFPVRRGIFSRVQAWVKAVSNISFAIGPGETLGMVGESGCGKTTVARLLVRLLDPDSGSIQLDGVDMASLKGRSLKPFRRKIQMVFQDPYSSLNPRMKIGEIIAEPLLIHGEVTRSEKKDRVSQILAQVGMSADSYDRYPHEFSGGQRQRIGIARAIALKPRLIVADEPVAALDVSIAAQVVNLLQDLQQKHGMSYLFISHDLKMIHHVSRRVIVMYLGKIVEAGPKELVQRPLHPYTKALVAAVPVADPQSGRKRILLEGEVPSPLNPPPGCAFHTRCPFAEKRCREEEPLLREWEPGRWAACHLADRIP